MLSIIGSATAILSLSCFVSASPISAREVQEDAGTAGFSPFPLANGFPTPNQGQEQQIFQEARGTLPNGPTPDKISDEGIFSLQVVALNELFEVAFFDQLLYNITNSVPGYQIPDSKKYDFAVKSLTAVRAVSCATLITLWDLDLDLSQC